MNMKYTAKLAAVTVGTMLIASFPMVSSASGQFGWSHAAPDGYPAMHYDYQRAKRAADRGTNDVLTNQSEFRHAPPDGYPAANYGDTANRTDAVERGDGATTLAKVGNASQQAFRPPPPDGYPAANYGYATDAARTVEHATKM